MFKYFLHGPHYYFSAFKRLFYWPHHILEYKRSILLHQYGLELLELLHSTLKQEKIVYWLYGGTLLGWVRDHNFIENDTDIDIGVWYTRADQLRIEQCLNQNGFNKNWEYAIDGKIHEQRFEYKGVGLDISCFFHTNDHISSYSFRNNEQGFYTVEARYDKDAFDSINIYKANNCHLPIPTNYDKKVLTPLYNNWRVPITKTNFNPNRQNNQIHHKHKRASLIKYTPSIHSHRPNLLAILHYYLTRKVDGHTFK